MSNLVRTGVIGVGWGRMHVEAYQACPDTVPVAICDANPDRLAERQRQYGITRGYSDYRELLEQPDIDAVSIALPNDLHVPVAIAALQAGKHVLCEKPLAITGDAAAQIVAVAREYRRKLMVCFNYRYRPDAQWLKQLLDEGRFGQLYAVKTGWLRNSGIPNLGSWFTCKAQSGGGPLIDLGVHMLDLALWLLGYPAVQTVSAVSFAEFGPHGRKIYVRRSQAADPRAQPNAPRPFDVEDMLMALIRFADGRALQLEVNWATHTAAGRDDYFLTLYGTAAGADLYVANYATTDTVTLHSDPGGVMSSTRPVFRQQSRISLPSGHDALVDHFARCILDDLEPSPGGDEGVALMRLIDAIYASAHSGREVVVERTGERTKN